MTTDKESFADLLGEFDRQPAERQTGSLKPGDRVRGTVVNISGDSVFVDLGGKSEGVMGSDELRDADGGLGVAVGDSVEAVVIRVDDRSGTLLLGSKTDQHIHDPAELENAYRNGIPVDGLVTGTTKGGLEIQIAGARGFCPASQIDTHYVEDLETYVGQRFAFRITRYEGGRHINLVVSRRVLLEEEQQRLGEETRARLEVGAVLEGTVTSLQDYGAFVDLGGVEGMVHISEIAFGHVKHPQDVLSVGQRVEVAVLRMEKTDNPRRPEKIALSIRARARDPWEDAEQRFPVGTRVKGTVTRIQPFGAFVELEPGIEGLVHVSELGAGRRISDPHEVVSPGDPVQANVLSVDLDKRRIGLSLGDDRQIEAGADEVQAYTKSPKRAADVGTFGELLRESLKKGGK